MKYLQQSTCCVIAHDPETLGIPKNEIYHRYLTHLDRAVKDGYNTFVFCMTGGADMWIAELICQMNYLNTVCVLPYKGFCNNWDENEKQQCESILSNAKKVEYVFEKYFPQCVYKTYQYAIDFSSRVVFYYNGTRDNIKKAVTYAKKIDVEICNALDYPL